MISLELILPGIIKRQQGLDVPESAELLDG